MDEFLTTKFKSLTTSKREKAISNEIAEVVSGLYLKTETAFMKKHVIYK